MTLIQEILETCVQSVANKSYVRINNTIIQMRDKRNIKDWITYYINE